MNQIRLITDSRDEWTVKELVETLHAKVDDLERKLDAQLKRNETISWQLHAIILHLTGDRAALTAFVMASEPTVVPNEDEAMPVLTQSQYNAMSEAERLDRLAKAKCPQCDRRAYSEQTVESEFGYRTMADGKTIVQSWCRECRKLEQATSPRKSPTYWSKMCPIAKAHSKTVQSARKMQKQLKAKLETKLSPSERAAYETRLTAEQQVESKHKSFYNTRIAELGYVHPNKAKRAAAKANGNK